MLDRFLVNKDAIELFATSPEAIQANKNQRLPVLSAVEWEKIRLIREVLYTINGVFLNLQVYFGIVTFLEFYYKSKLTEKKHNYFKCNSILCCIEKESFGPENCQRNPGNA
jgi:hypothetical protein